MATTSFRFYIDPGHGWLQVYWVALKELGLNPTDFSRYSYRNGNTFYLEEDCDAPKFLDAYKAKYGRQPAIVEIHRDGWNDKPIFIRKLPPIHSLTTAELLNLK